MGRSDRSPPRRRRSRSNSPRRRDDGKHRDRRSDKSSKSHSSSKTSEDMKRYMREAFSAARNTIDDKKTDIKQEIEELTPTEKAFRQRQIERIEASGFQADHFEASAGGAGGRVYHKTKKTRDLKESKLTNAEREHENLIFGPPGRPTTDTKKVKEEVVDDIPLPARDDSQLLHSNFLKDPTDRREAWLKRWTEQRQALGVF